MEWGLLQLITWKCRIALNNFSFENDSILIEIIQVYQVTVEFYYMGLNHGLGETDNKKNK